MEAEYYLPNLFTKARDRYIPQEYTVSECQYGFRLMDPIFSPRITMERYRSKNMLFLDMQKAFECVPLLWSPFEMCGSDSEDDHSANQEGNNAPRKNYISWQEYHMGVAMLSAERSKDPNCQVGACIVNSENKIVGVGYNGMPLGCDDDIMAWGNDKSDMINKNKKYYVCHAELNAIAFKGIDELKGCTIYVTRIPCNNCAQLVIQSGIKKVVFLNNNYSELEKASRRMFRIAGVALSQYKRKGRVLKIKI